MTLKHIIEDCFDKDQLVEDNSPKILNDPFSGQGKNTVVVVDNILFYLHDHVQPCIQ